MACLTKYRGKPTVDFEIFGKRKRRAFTTKAQAEAFLRDLKLREIDNLIGFKELKIISVLTAVDEYLLVVTPKKELRTREVDIQTLNKFGKTFKDLNVQEIQSQNLEFYQMQLVNEGLKASSVNRKFNVIKHFFRKCTEWKYCRENPSLNLNKLKEAPVVRKPLDLIQIDAVIDALPSWAARAFYFAVKTGVRRSGVCSLSWECVDFENGSVKIFSKKGGRRIVENDIPMTNDIRSLLLTLWNEKNKSTINREFVFLNAQGEKIIPSTLTRKLIDVRKKSGVPNAGLHIARHTVLTDLSSANQSGAIIQKLAGHSSLSTSQKYVHHRDSELKLALENAELNKPIKIPLKLVGSCR